MPAPPPATAPDPANPRRAASAAHRRLLAMTMARCAVTVVILGTAYAVMPVGHLGGASVLVRLVVALVAFGGAIVWQIRAILSADHPQLRAVEALALAVTMLVVLFAYVYLSLSATGGQTFSEHLDRPTAIYFTVTVLGTVGFGDIVPVSTGARLVVSVQMLLDLVVIGAIVRILFIAAQRSLARQSPTEGTA